MRRSLRSQDKKTSTGVGRDAHLGRLNCASDRALSRAYAALEHREVSVRRSGVPIAPGAQIGLLRSQAKKTLGDVGRNAHLGWLNCASADELSLGDG